MIVLMQLSAFLPVCLISGKQSASLLISTVIDRSAARYMAFPIGRYQGQMQRVLTLGEKGHSSHRKRFRLRERSVGEWIIQQTGPGRSSRSAMLLTRMFSSGRLRGRSTFHLDGSVAHELIAGKSISRGTRWINWVPVFVWDDEEGVLSYQLRPVLDTLWSVAARAHGFRFCDELVSSLSFSG